MNNGRVNLVLVKRPLPSYKVGLIKGIEAKSRQCWRSLKSTHMSWWVEGEVVQRLKEHEQKHEVQLGLKILGFR